LGVTKDSTDSEIKKAYKKLALQLHPDKNKAPGAMDAFKALSNAFTTLTDVQKRKQYDLFSTEEQENVRYNRTSSGHTHSTYQHSHNRGFESDFTPEELFNMFFGGSYSQQQTRRRYQAQQQQNSQQQEPSVSYWRR
jgi:DnaJ homolog subfamily B member 12